MTFDLVFLKAVIADAFKWSVTEKAYVESHLCLYQTLLASESPEEFLMNFDIMKCSMTFPLVDYIAIFAGGLAENFMITTFGQFDIKIDQFLDKLQITPVLIKLIDDYDVFDAAIKTSAFPRSLLSVRSVYMKSSAMHQLVDIVLAHMFNKFPDLFNMQFNFTKRKGKRFQRFKRSDMEKNLVYRF